MGMIFSKAITKTLERYMVPQTERSLGLTYPEFKRTLIEAVKEYGKLTTRHWKRKRELNETIASYTRSLAKFLDTLEVPDKTFYEVEHNL
jgi:hypothetical protein